MDEERMIYMGQHFQKWEELTEKWFLPGKPSERKKHLKKAFKEIKPVLEWLSESGEYPDGLDPLTLASKVLGMRQTPQHTEMVVPFVKSIMTNMIIGGKPLGTLCGSDPPRMVSSCSDLYALLCNALHDLEAAGIQGTLPGYDAAQCIADYNSPRPAERQFKDAAHCHRQFPGLRAKPWWPNEEAAGAVQRIHGHVAEIREEVLRVVGAEGFAAWDPLKNDPTLTTNEDWDPRASWDAIQIFFQNEWIEESCALFPTTCSLLKAETSELERLFDTRRFDNLVSKDLKEQGYEEVPTLGIKLYRVWPGAGLKRHVGSPGRLVSAMALAAPPGTTITVGAETRSWVADAFHTFDDAFYHSVDNPSSEHRIVLTFMTWHPDFHPLRDATGHTSEL